MFRCSGDNTIGPVLTSAFVNPNCYDFDFTLVFEDSLFSIIPCGIVLLVTAWRLHTLVRRDTIVRWPLLRALKLVTFAIQAVLQLSLLGLEGSGHGTVTRTTVAASVVALVSTVGLLILADFEHCRTTRPSAIIQSFLLLTILLDLPRVRTSWLLDGGSVVAAVFTATFAIRIVLLTLESIPKWKRVVAGPEIPPEERQGIFGRIFFWWLMPMFREGYRRDLSMDDLFAIDDDLKGDTLSARLLKSWESVNRNRRHCLTAAVLWTFLPELSLALVPRLAYSAFSLVQPYLIHAMITYITLHSRLPDNFGYGLIGAYALCYTGLALSQRLWMQIAFRTMTKIRGSLVTVIYKKMLRVRAETENSSAAVSLMSTDVDRITMTTFLIVHLIPDIIQLVIALGILGSELGATAVAPVILCLICIGIAARIGKLVPPRQRRWMAAIQKRVGITADIIAAMKGVKVAGLGEKVDKQIQGLRNYELERSVQFRKMQITTQLLGTAPTLLMPAVTFTVYAVAQKLSGGGQFGVVEAFTALSLLNILVQPVMDLTTAWTNLSSALACLDRIQAFLLKENRDDYRMLMSHSHDYSEIPEKIETSEEPVIKIRRGCFGWKKDSDKAIIKDINLDIMPGELTLIVGPVASGKSTLLKAILGEARIISGSVEFTIPEEIAYCDQDAWLLNQSVKENILAFEEYNESFYDTVVEACQLEEDLGHFPKGDDSIIGSRGISLSGGQKQRVALARAVYNRKPVVILDDVFKGLDADTYAKCFSATLGPGGLMRQGRTAVIMATHNVQLLPHAEHIVVLDEEGHITEKGSFDDLSSSSGYVSSLGLKKAAVKEIEAVVAEEEEIEKIEKKAVLEKLASIEPKAEPKKSRGRRNSDAMFSYIQSMGKVSFPIFCLFTFCNIGFRSAQPLWLNVWTAANGRSDDSSTGYYTGIYMLFGGLNVLFLALQFWTFMIIIVPYSAKLLHRRVLTAVMHAPLPFFVKTDTGEIVNRFSQDMTLVDMQLPMSFMQSYSQIINAIAQIVLTCVGSGWLGVAVPVMLILLFCLQKFYLRTSRQMRLLDLEAKSPLYTHFIASFAGLTALRAYGWSKLSEEENIRRLNDSQRPFYLLRCVQRWLTMVLNLIVAGLAVLLVGISIALKDSMNPGLLGVALTSVMGIGQTLSQLIQSWTQVETSLGAVTRINEFAASTPKEPDGPDMPPQNWPDRGAIKISGLYATYGDHTVLTDINLDIQPGQKIAVCGRSGSGKSTLITLLLRLYEPASGRIVIDGIDTETLNLNALREALVALPQDPMFLAGSVRYNLDPLGRSSDAEVFGALEKTGIRDVIEAKGGLEADLNTDWLSAGQRQLFCLARAMLRNSKVILLDEATSSLDRETEACVDRLVRTEFKDWTAIVVAHRLKTIADFDKVLVLQEGRMIEYDSPSNLLARDSKFKMLWDLQES